MAVATQDRDRREKARFRRGDIFPG